ncbi:hypothetical protein HBI56_033340 [Parastagonospora nodorum]|uniref:Uncharacterized protein n=1 Tax=Phaeosphaeria nodorum (strain SN15 / ATCC MYA-4574 / FGSC 10173) TaxID=321614 RepID=A0A7U2EZ14_PHANO|nr:hypothetical protein HBH56_021130 [Parastagonospora nodorum]QRC95481.1 hypothetical protein JI435_031660 [Parastagonospora nodorum SN15]KAH3937478.1 hypothetical protein HBH54_013360 [Parastagonospora nodorum]KAH3944206.1 hypothetical protein HBH53_163390 [Parastagonospora nodorum]KAH3967514.1 hypothetical protein HBH51_137090 [Parastagonospora nodorum]
MCSHNLRLCFANIRQRNVAYHWVRQTAGFLVDYISHHPIIIQDPKLGRLKVHSYSKRK